MDLRLQPKPKVEFLPTDRGIISRKRFFVKKKFEQINQYFFAGHFIRNWKPKAELLYSTVPNEPEIQYEYDFNREVQNCFVEDYAEEVYLRTPPPCFFIFGKFKREVNNLCRKLTDAYGSVLIQADDIVNQVLKTNTETSKLVDRILRLGVSLTLNFILALVCFMAHTREARHRGYVLCGLPYIPLFYDLSIEKQINYLFTWDNKPNIFIHILFNDEDLLVERPNLRVKLHRDENGENYLCTQKLTKNDQEESESEDEMKPIKEHPGYEPDINVKPSDQCAQLPRNEESRVWCDLELYNNMINPVVDLILSRVDPQYFIAVDARVGNEYEMVIARLSLLQIWRVPEARQLIPEGSQTIPEGFSEEDDEIEQDSVPLREVPPEKGFLALFAKDALSPKFRWELSHYNYICPVSLRENEVVEGKTKYAVVFMKYMYFLRDEECMRKFIQNPRAYVLPIRPKPLCRFIVLGYPYSGKTTLAETLAEEFSIPLINFETILQNDSERKKETYREFCKKKAECREIIRLTAEAWQEWRMEEEKRIGLIEEWILYIQGILTKRIEQFYSTKSDESLLEKKLEIGECVGEENLRAKSEDSATSACADESGENEPADVRNEEKANVNEFFSTLWDCFSDEKRNLGKSKLKGEGSETSCSDYYEEFYESYGEGEELGEELSVESITVDWCNYLPPQSLSSFLMSKTPYTSREKRQSFKIFLDAASKVYWQPSALKSEFAKWRLPCFMDIPLCEIFLDNPLLLLRYVPMWLQERPLIPEPIDDRHPSVVEASEQAYWRAAVVTVEQSEEEMGILLRDAIEKAEREGMRVTEEVISPGGWVVDNMTLDLKVWNKLACESVFADHIYILIDTEPDYRRIINLWWEICGTDDTITSTETISEEEEFDETLESSLKRLSGSQRKSSEELISIMNLLMQRVDEIATGEDTLDKVYENLQDEKTKMESETKYFTFGVKKSKTSVGQIPFIMHEDYKEPAFEYNFSRVSSIYRESFPEQWDVCLGVPLEVFTDALLDYFKKKPKEDDEAICEAEDCLKFFIDLLTLPKKITKFKEWMASIGRDSTIREIEMTGKTPEAVLLEIKTALMEPFIKKPRELEDFEIDEIQKSTPEPVTVLDETEAYSETTRIGSEVAEDVRIFGESGQLCVVNLERDIYLPGKLEFSLRYYGKLYYFWNQEAKDKFIEDPEKYAPYYSAIRCYPPLRIFVMGPVGSGKTTLARHIARECGLPYIDYPRFVLSKIVPHAPFVAAWKSSDKLLLADESNEPAKAAKEQFLKASTSSRQYWLENSSYGELFNKELVLQKIKELLEPEIYPDFPELSYEFIGATLQEKSQKESDNELSDFASSLPDIPYTRMVDLQTLVSDYLWGDAELTSYCWEKTFKTLWTTEPYISQGFVLEGFYLRKPDVKNTIQNNWIPDLVVEINLPAETVIQRNIDNFMENWETELNRQMIEEKAVQTTLSNIQSILTSRRRVELMKELLPEKAPELGLKSTTHITVGSEEVHNEVDLDLPLSVKRHESSLSRTKILRGSSKTSANILDEKKQAEIEEILIKEFPPLVFNPVFETYESGKTKIINNMTDAYKRYESEAEKIKSDLNEYDIPWVVVNEEKSLEETLAELQLKIDAVRKREMKGEFAFTVTMEMAERLLQQGYYFLSKFGRWCPVQVYQMRNPINMFRPYAARGKITPIVYRNYIYFVAGENEKNKFLEDPIKYTFNEPKHPNIPLRIAVIGPPKCGKTTLSTRLGLMFDLKVITMGSAIRFVLERVPDCTLAKSIESYLRRGSFLPLSLKVEALLISLNDPTCVTQGFVFDGIPFDAALTQSLAERGKLPFVIISLVANAYFGKCNREALDLNQFRLPYKNRVNLDARYEDWGSTYKRFVQWNEATYNNLYEVNAKSNVVNIFYQAYDIIRKSYFDILSYVQYCVSNKVAPLQYLCVSQHEYDMRKSAFNNNCPVCWAEEEILSNASDPPPRSGLVQYKEHFYWICPKHMGKFVEHPKKYLPPFVPKWPEIMARKLNSWEKKSYMENSNVHGNGRCPVTRTDFPDRLDWEGSWEFAVEYAGEVFLCKNEDMLGRFLRQPWRYHKADTKFEGTRNHKSVAVVKLGPPLLTTLPPIGFLEQTVADTIHECLQILGTVRPVYPNMSPSVTGCIFLALYLKAHNKRNKNPLLEKRYLSIMLKSCRAFSFKVETVQYQDDLDQGEPDYSECEKSDSELSASGDSLQPLRFQGFSMNETEKKLWGAKKISKTHVEMGLTEDDQLIEIPELPKTPVLIKYGTDIYRSSPIPPIQNCLNFLYTPRAAMQIPEKFDYRTLYQPPISDLTFGMLINPNKQFSTALFQGTAQSMFPSQPNLNKGPRVYSYHSLVELTRDGLTESKIDVSYRRERFLPRFRLLDTLKSVKVPSMPKVVPEESILYDPALDYTYSMLFSEFFHATHVLRCFSTTDNCEYKEFSHRLDEDLGLTTAATEFLISPRVTASMKSRTSLESYQRVFDAATSFLVDSHEPIAASEFMSDKHETPVRNESLSVNESIGQRPSPTSSDLSVIRAYLEEKIDELITQICDAFLNFSVEVVTRTGRRQIVFRENLPYPPLSWDIISRPYHAYTTLQSVFGEPSLKYVTHERRFSVMDGIAEPNEGMRFVEIPFLSSERRKSMRSRKGEKKRYSLYYDFFNLPWTSFLTYPYKLAYRETITEISGHKDVVQDPSCES